MTIRFSPASRAMTSEEFFILPLFQGEKELPVAFPKQIRTLIDAVRSSKEFSGAHSETHILSYAVGKRVRRVCLLGLGERSALTIEEYRKAIGAAAMRMKKARVKNGAILLRSSIVAGASDGDLVHATTLGVELGAYHFTQYKGKKKDAAALRLVTLIGERALQKDAPRAIREAQLIAQGMQFVKDMGNTPPNILTPAALAARTQEAARGIAGLTVTVLDKKALEKEKMGGLLGVAQGSQHEPRLIVIEYKSVALRQAPLGLSSGRRQGKPTVLVGKAITFDSGGISIKPSPKMDEMKFDMAGGAAVIGTLIAAARLKLPVHLVGIVCAAENMPSHNAYKPGDILTMGDGTTVEVLNTDAEGRIVLADGLVYARRYKPETIIDIATLTGAIVVALGDYATGLFTDDPELVQQLNTAGQKSGELVWHMPMPKRWEELLKSSIADLRHVPVTRIADGSLGALFIRAFAEKGVRFAHLDIGGTAWQTGSVSYEEPGATGVGVRLFIEYLQLHSQK